VNRLSLPLPGDLRPYRGPASNVVTNGLLLRADIHTLMDLQFLATEPVSRTIEISKQLTGTQYEEIAGRPLADPLAPSQRPSDDVLKELWQNFQRAENEQ
jgi:putative restriction endonuclease